LNVASESQKFSPLDLDRSEAGLGEIIGCFNDRSLSEGYEATRFCGGHHCKKGGNYAAMDYGWHYNHSSQKITVP
jgi:hypothetical protein